jgi:hypothetical protein
MRKPIKLLLKTLLALFIMANVVVIFHAYKLTHFYNRNEVTVKKQEDKNGWDKTKEMLFGINAVKQINTAPDTIVQTVFFTTENKLKLEGWYFPASKPKGTIAMFHGHGGKKSSMLAEAALFRKLGYNTLLLDFRAHGNSEGNTCTIGYRESEDVKLVYDYLVKNAEKNIILYGISMGAAAAMKAVEDYKLQPSRIILEMPFGSLPEAVEGRLKIMHLPTQPLAAMLTFWGGTTQGFWAFNLKPSDYAKKITCPVLMQWGKKDPRVSEEETQLIYKNISSTKRLVIYDQSGHESLYKKEPRKWENEITAFLQ